MDCAASGRNLTGRSVIRKAKVRKAGRLNAVRKCATLQKNGNSVKRREKGCSEDEGRK